MPMDKFDELQWLAGWLYEAARQANQVEMVRGLIRTASKEVTDTYGLPSDGEPDDPKSLPSIVGRFAFWWDETDRREREVAAE